MRCLAAGDFASLLLLFSETLIRSSSEMVIKNNIFCNLVFYPFSFFTLESYAQTSFSCCTVRYASMNFDFYLIGEILEKYSLVVVFIPASGINFEARFLF